MSPETAAEREARMERAAAARRGEQRVAPGRLATRTRPVRTTVDLPPELHRRLKLWAADAADALDVPDVPTAEVFRALLRLLLDDPDTNDAVMDALRRKMRS